MQQYVAKWLILWGILIDFIFLGGMPLTGNCQVYDQLIKMGPPCDMNNLASVLVTYIYLLCGVMRLMAGLYPDSHGCWYTGMASMLLEISLVWQVWSLPSSPSNGGVHTTDGAFALCGLTFVAMAICAPSAGKAKRG